MGDLQWWKLPRQITICTDFIRNGDTNIFFQKHISHNQAWVYVMTIVTTINFVLLAYTYTWKWSKQQEHSKHLLNVIIILITTQDPSQQVSVVIITQTTCFMYIQAFTHLLCRHTILWYSLKFCFCEIQNVFILWKKSIGSLNKSIKLLNVFKRVCCLNIDFIWV